MLAHFDHPVEKSTPMDAARTLPDDSPGEWIRIFATWFARSRPNLSAEDVVALAIREFKADHEVSPEQAAARCNG